MLIDEAFDVGGRQFLWHFLYRVVEPVDRHAAVVVEVQAQGQDTLGHLLDDALAVEAVLGEFHRAADVEHTHYL